MLFFVPLVLTSWILVPQLHLWHLCLTLSYLRKSRYRNRRIWHIIFCKSHGEHLCATSLSSAPISWLRYCKLQRFTWKFVACPCSEILGASCRKCHVPGSLFLPSSIRSSVLTHVVRDIVAAVAQNKCREIRHFIWKLFGKNKYHQNHYMLIRSNTVKQTAAVNLQEVVCSVYATIAVKHARRTWKTPATIKPLVIYVSHVVDLCLYLNVFALGKVGLACGSFAEYWQCSRT